MRRRMRHTSPLGFCSGVKARPVRMRREERQVRKTKQGKRPCWDSRYGLIRLQRRIRIKEEEKYKGKEYLCFKEVYLSIMVNTELPAVTIPFTRPSRFWRHGVKHNIRGRILLTFV